MDEKTKEIMERLRKGSRAIWDGEKPIDFRPSGSDITEAADIITRLSERVEELEAEARKSACEILSAEACVEDLKHLLSKQEERG